MPSVESAPKEEFVPATEPLAAALRIHLNLVRGIAVRPQIFLWFGVRTDYTAIIRAHKYRYVKAVDNG
jgi:hypothetical protein